MDVSQFLTDERLATSVVGRKLDDLLWPEEIRREMKKEPPPGSIIPAKEMNTGWKWEGEPC